MNKVKATAKAQAVTKAKTKAKAKSKAAKQAAQTAHYGPKAQVTFWRNIWPVLAGVLVMVVVMATLNGQWLTAQLKYRFTKPAVIAGAPVQVASAGTGGQAASTKSPHPELGPQVTIPAINVVAPIELDQGTAEWQIQLGLRKGVVHYDSSALPGAAGNVVIFGHSSGQPWAPGNYKFVFTLLDKVRADDAVYLDYNGTRYTYKVVRSEVVAPTDVGVLQQGSGHELTLITCTPVGTSKNRLVVHAEQVSPDPNAKAQPAVTAAATAGRSAKPAATPQELPGTARGSIWQTIRSWF